MHAYILKTFRFMWSNFLFLNCSLSSLCFKIYTSYLYSTMTEFVMGRDHLLFPLFPTQVCLVVCSFVQTSIVDSYDLPLYLSSCTTLSFFCYKYLTVPLYFYIVRNAPECTWVK
ncbi:hypothetical protein GYMLUDRAFT_542435 [Collybiopsis luxurians FD-317 M1]|nr:hypothetical protein GYMLUDRAFT_542435 [Collybiopsis luxurians FD-317 M1]